MENIKNMATQKHQTIVMVTHDVNLARFANKIIHIHDGQIVEIKGEN